MADLEKGLWGANTTHSNEAPLRANYIFAMLKGGPNVFALKGGDAQAGQLTTYFEGTRPSGISIVDACSFLRCRLHHLLVDTRSVASILVWPNKLTHQSSFVATTWFRSIAARWWEL
jgi:hypothetical protein